MDDDPIEQQVWARRAALHAGPVQPRRPWGLALSGGGIRSATFCFGLLHALAQRGLLLRFDLMSTVSGGGYIGATLGALFHRAANAAGVRRVAEALADAPSRWFAWWLRANGRYLVPRGAKDRTFAIALFLRNLIGVHLELGTMALVLGVLLALTDLAAWWALAWLGFHHPTGLFDLGRWLVPPLPVLLLLLPLLVAIGCVVAMAYWTLPWVLRRRLDFPERLVPLWLAAVVAAALAWPWLWSLAQWPVEGQVQRVLLLAAGAALLIAWLLAVPLAGWAFGRTPVVIALELRGDLARNRLTRWLANGLRVMLVLLVLAALDRLAWHLAFERTAAIEGTGLALGVLAVLGRAVLPLASGLAGGGGSLAVLLPLGRLLGYGLTFLLTAWWVSLVYRAGLGALFQREPSFSAALQALAAIGVPALGYLVLAGRYLDFLNLSSLHGFYRARLVRSYLGAANARRFGLQSDDGGDSGGDAPGTLAPVPSALPATPRLKAVSEVHADDDLPLSDYQPQLNGGPIHLINSCINQTRDPRGGLFNQDRRGLALTVASGGWVQVAREGWRHEPQPEARRLPSLGAWTAISGAAVSPGLGALTRGGISALATFAGLRLGYWWRRHGGALPLWPPCAKSLGLLRETFGNFRGTEQPEWFLTDGGHFENTGAYALLAERAELIVLADCGADPQYRFGDLENLVRKARIDLQAELVFQRPREVATAGQQAVNVGTGRPQLPHAMPLPQPLPEELQAFGSLSDLASPHSSACLAFATIAYGGERPGRGVLIVVKPNVCRGLPVDLENFKASTPEFPQQGTADQFFSEAQWESYFQLGRFLGSKLSVGFIERLIEQPQALFEDDLRSGEGRAATPAGGAGAAAGAAAGSSGALAGAATAAMSPAMGPAPSRLSPRISATAMRTTLGLGALATVGVTVWQGLDALDTAHNRRVADERAGLRELSELWAKLPPRAAPAASAAPTLNALAATLVRTADALCPGGEAGWFRDSPLASHIRDATLEGCTQLPFELRAPACTLLVDSANTQLQRPLPDCLLSDSETPHGPQPVYWLYDYRHDAAVVRAHPCDPAAHERRRAEQRHLAHQAALAGGRSEIEAMAKGLAAAEAVLIDPRCPVPPRIAASPVAAAAAPIEAPTTTASATARSGTATSATAAPGPEAPATSPLPPITVAEPRRPMPLLPLAAVCQGRTVYLQYFGAAERERAESYRRRWLTAGLSVPPAEDVTASAQRAGRAPLAPVTDSAVRFHDLASRPCALQLGPIAGFGDWRVEPLGAMHRPAPGMVEVWLAPAARGTPKTR